MHKELLHEVLGDMRVLLENHNKLHPTLEIEIRKEKLSTKDLGSNASKSEDDIENVGPEREIDISGPQVKILFLKLISGENKKILNSILYMFESAKWLKKEDGKDRKAIKS